MTVARSTTRNGLASHEISPAESTGRQTLLTFNNNCAFWKREGQSKISDSDPSIGRVSVSERNQVHWQELDRNGRRCHNQNLKNSWFMASVFLFCKSEWSLLLSSAALCCSFSGVHLDLFQLFYCSRMVICHMRQFVSHLRQHMIRVLYATVLRRFPLCNSLPLSQSQSQSQCVCDMLFISCTVTTRRYLGFEYNGKVT